MRNSPTPPSEANRRRDAIGRDRAIARVRRTTRWVVAGAVAGTGVLVGLAAHDARGHAAGASTTLAPSQGSGNSGTSSGAGSSGPADSPSAASGAGGGGFSPPPASPSQTRQAPQMVTGQS